MARNVLIITSQEHQTTTGILPEIRSFNFSVKTRRIKKDSLRIQKNQKFMIQILMSY